MDITANFPATADPESGREGTIKAAKTKIGDGFIFIDAQNERTYHGPVVAVSDTHIVQRTGVSTAIIHRMEKMPKNAVFSRVDAEQDIIIIITCDEQGNKIDLQHLKNITKETEKHSVTKTPDIAVAKTPVVHQNPERKSNDQGR